MKKLSHELVWIDPVGNIHISSNVPSVAQFLNNGTPGKIKIGHSYTPTSEKVLQPHEHLFVAGDVQSHVYQVLEGVISVYELLPDGRRQIATFCYPGDLIGVNNIDQFAHNAESLCAARVRCIPLTAMNRLISTEPGFSTALLGVLSTELAETRDQLLSLGRKSALEKVATFLLRISRRNEREGVDETQLHLPMSRAEIADFLGLTIETVSRNFTKLKVSGIIALPSSAQVQVVNLARLEVSAEGGGH